MRYCGDVGLKNGQSGSNFIQARADVLGRFWVNVYSRIVVDLQNMAPKATDRTRSLLLLQRVDNILEHADKETKKFVDTNVPLVYKAFGTEALKDARKLRPGIGKELSQIHEEAQRALADDAYLKFGNLRAQIQRSAQETVQLAKQTKIREQLAAGQALGLDARDIAGEVEKTIKDQGVVGLITRSGSQLQVDDYAQMLTETMLANSARDGTKNVALEFGFDLVRVTTHGSDHPECAKFEGKVLSLSGDTPGVWSIEQATDEGLFHPRCKHNYFVVDPLQVRPEDKIIPA